MNHTPTPLPWTAECVGITSHGPDGTDVYEIVAGEARRVAEYVIEKDAAFIVRACNAHDEVVAALVLLLADYCEILVDYEIEADSGLIERCEAALARVGFNERTPQQEQELDVGRNRGDF